MFPATSPGLGHYGIDGINSDALFPADALHGLDDFHGTPGPSPRQTEADLTGVAGRAPLR